MELVNPVPIDEVEPWSAAVTTTLLFDPPPEDFGRLVENRRRSWVPARTWGVRDRGRWIATLATLERSITVPGAAATTIDVPADALTAVTVAATHRRRGLLRQMISQSLQAAVDRGDSLSILIAAEWPIYGRFGYAPATRSATYSYFPRLAGARIAADPSGAVRQLEPGEVARDASAVFDRARRRWAGQVERPDLWWSRRLGTDGHEQLSTGRGVWVVHEGDDGPDGLLAWKVTRDFELNGDLGALEVLDFAAASDTAYRNLWSYLSGIDVISEITLRERPLDEPVRWLLGDGRALRQVASDDHTWVRLLNVPAALSARGYDVPGRIVLKVFDDAPGGYAAGRYLLDASPAGATCVRTTGSADLQLSQRTLASVYLGDHSLRTLTIAGGIDELTPGALARADAMFATAQRPWNATPF